MSIHLDRLRIVLAEPGHLDAMRELLVRVFVDEGYQPSTLVAALEQSLETPHHAEIFVALAADEDVVGCVALASSQSMHAEIARTHEAELRMLAVAPVARGGRVGEALVGACLERAKVLGLERLVISTSPSMHEARRLYSRLGFERLLARDFVKKDGRARAAYVLDLHAP